MHSTEISSHLANPSLGHSTSINPFCMECTGYQKVVYDLLESTTAERVSKDEWFFRKYNKYAGNPKYDIQLQFSQSVEAVRGKKVKSNAVAVYIL
eukprot:9899009-Ditylum_brightwellii.AAC.1